MPALVAFDPLKVKLALLRRSRFDVARGDPNNAHNGQDKSHYQEDGPDAAV
jgi:hypothetical protein